AVAGHRVDQPGRVADEQRALARDPRPRTAHRQPMAAQLPEVGGLQAVRGAEAREVLAQTWPLALPAADADIRVVALREDPAVPTGDAAELEQRPSGIVLAPQPRVRDVALVGDSVDQPFPETQCAARRAVRPVDADDADSSPVLDV